MRNLRVQNCAGLLLVAIINPALAQAHPGPQAPVSETALVTPDNFNRAETDMYFGGSVKEGGLGTFRHNREATPIDKQMVIRMNRDTLYSLSVFDLDAGPVTVTLPNSGQRFMSMQVIDEDHYAPEVIYGTGSYTFTREKIGTRYVSLGVRILVDPTDPEDMKQVHAFRMRLRSLSRVARGSSKCPTGIRQARRGCARRFWRWLKPSLTPSTRSEPEARSILFDT